MQPRGGGRRGPWRDSDKRNRRGFGGGRQNQGGYGGGWGNRGDGNQQEKEHGGAGTAQESKFVWRKKEDEEIQLNKEAEGGDPMKIKIWKLMTPSGKGTRSKILPQKMLGTTRRIRRLLLPKQWHRVLRHLIKLLR